MTNEELKEINNKLKLAQVKKLLKEIAKEELKDKKGDEGIKGMKGDTGSPGKDGAKGKDGLPGKDGADGTDGKNGKDGTDGKKGLRGLKGLQGKKGADGKDGKDGKNGKDGKDGKDGSPDTGHDIIKKISDLPLEPENMIDAGRIKNLRFPIMFNPVKKSSTSAGSTMQSETPTGSVDDSNLTFTVGNEPFFINVNGAIYKVGEGIYDSYAGGTITLLFPVGTGGFIRSFYQ